MMEDTTYSRMKKQLSNLITKETQINSDIFFLSRCKKKNLIPHGLRIKNPCATTLNSPYAEGLCKRTSERLRNNLIHKLYGKRITIRNEKQLIIDTLTALDPTNINQMKEGMETTQRRLQKLAMNKKQKKLHQLYQESTLWIQPKEQKTNTTSTTPTISDLNAMPESQNNPCEQVDFTENVDMTEELGIINLSDYNLSKSEISTLSKGLTFCPTTKLDHIQVFSDMEDFFRRLRLKEYFHNNKNNPRTMEYDNKKKNSNFTPSAGRNPKLDTYIDSFRLRVTSMMSTQQKKYLYNLSPLERNAIQELRNNQAITIKPADKGGAVVVMDTNKYIQEGKRQLSDPMYYKKLDYNPTQDFSKQLKGLIKALPTHLHSELNSAIPENPELGNFYMLPKIHKPGNPGRPIITGMNTLTEQISGIVENILKPLVKNTASYLQDTTDFLNKLHNIQLPSESILVTMDVLYIQGKSGCSRISALVTTSLSTVRDTFFICTNSKISGQAFGVYPLLQGPSSIETQVVSTDLNTAMHEREEKK